MSGATVFVYGTLMAPAASDKVRVHSPHHRGMSQRLLAARVQGYFRHRIRGHIFPGVQQAGPGDEVCGLVRASPAGGALRYWHFGAT